MSVRDLLDCDNEFQVGLQAAAQVWTNVRAREECLLKCRSAIEREKDILKSLQKIESFDSVLSDIQWKESLLDNLPLEATEDQLRTLIVLVKCQPFISDAIS